MRRYIIVLLSMLAICSVPCQSQTIDRALFEGMVAITKHSEGWHDPKTTPGYVGYGHQLQKGERFPKTLTRQRADLLLRTDLLRHLRLYARYGRDAYLLATLSYQIGPAKLVLSTRFWAAKCQSTQKSSLGVLWGKASKSYLHWNCAQFKRRDAENLVEKG